MNVKLTPSQRTILQAIADPNTGYTHKEIRNCTGLDTHEEYQVVTYLRRLNLIRAERETRNGAEVSSMYFYCSTAGQQALECGRAQGVKEVTEGVNGAQ